MRIRQEDYQQNTYHEFVETRSIDGRWHQSEVVEQLPEIVLTQQALFIPIWFVTGEGVRG